MLVFCHLFLGAAIGLALASATGDRRLVAAGLLAGIVSDLIDKPLGHLLFASTLDNGRLVAHSLAFVAVVFVTALLTRGRMPLLAPVLALGVLSHQLLDAMWRDPATWFFPLLGPFRPGHYPDYFLSGLLAELASPSEWLFGAATLALVAGVLRPSILPPALSRSARRLLPVLAVAVGCMGALALVLGAGAIAVPLAPGLRAGDAVVLGCAALAGAAIVLYDCDRRRRKGGEQPG